jgi:hypothetical protein
MAAGTDISSEVLLERGAGFRQVQVVVDAAELTIGFEHPGSAHQCRAIACRVSGGRSCSARG